MHIEHKIQTVESLLCPLSIKQQALNVINVAICRSCRCFFFFFFNILFLCTTNLFFPQILSDTDIAFRKTLQTQMGCASLMGLFLLLSVHLPVKAFSCHF